jgi:hypothetical protein
MNPGEDSINRADWMMCCGRFSSKQFAEAMRRFLFGI